MDNENNNNDNGIENTGEEEIIKKVHTKAYSANSIKQENGAEAHRLRASRYMGASDATGITNQLVEIIDNSIDEIMDCYAGIVTKDITEEERISLSKQYGMNINPDIYITIHPDDVVEVEDFGRGIPCEINESTGVSAAIMVCESDSAGGKGRDTDGYTTDTAGTHGAGLAVSKSLATFFDLDINSGSAGGRYTLKYKEGIMDGDLERISDLTIDQATGFPITGTKITYKWDPKIFSKTLGSKHIENTFSYGTIAERLKYSMVDQKTFARIHYKYWEMNHMTKELEEVNEIITPNSITVKDILRNPDPILIEIDATQASTPYTIRTYFAMNPNGVSPVRKTIVNRLNTSEAHNNETILDEFIDFARKLIDRDDTLNAEQKAVKVNRTMFRDSLSFISILSLSDAEYAGQNKDKLVSTKYLAHLSYQLQTKMISDQEFIGKIYPIIRSQVVMSVALEKEKQKLEEKRKKELEKRKEAREAQDQLNDLMKDYHKRNEAQKVSKITLKPSPFPPNVSTLVYVEGDSAGSVLSDIHNDGDVPIAIATLTGNPPNAQKETVMSEITRDNIAFCLNKGYKYLAILSDGDSDGDHIKVLQSSHIMKYAKHYLDEGRVFIVPAAFGRVIVNKPTVLNLYGEIKVYTMGAHLTYSGKEHTALVNSGATQTDIFTGLADSNLTNPIDMLKDKSKWIQIKPVNEQDEDILSKLMESASDFKKDFTKLSFSDRQFYTKELDKIKKSIEISPRDYNKLFKPGMLSRKPSLAGYKRDIPNDVLRNVGEKENEV